MCGAAATRQRDEVGVTPYGEQEFASDFDVSRETLSRFRLYASKLEKWNRAINLVGRGTMPDLWRRHFLDSAQLLNHLPAKVNRATSWVDLGSGAGFPGLVLALLGAGEVHLVESDMRKSSFLREVSRETGLRVQVHTQRIESLHMPSVDYVTARACAPLPGLVDYARPLLRPGGHCLFLKGSNLDEELTLLRKAGKMHPDFARADVFASESDPQGRILRLGPYSS